METLQSIIAFVAMGAVFVAIAASLLAARDSRRSRELLSSLQTKLTQKQPCSSQDLVAYFPLPREQEIARRFRSRLATALQVHENSINPEDDLHKDYQLDVISPFLVAIASEFTRDPDGPELQQVFSYRNDATKFRDFVRAIAEHSKTI